MSRFTTALLLILMISFAGISSAKGTTDNLPKGMVDSLAQLDKDFTGLSGTGGVDTREMPDVVSKNEKQIDQLKSQCVADSRSYTKISEYLRSLMDETAKQYEPGKKLPNAVLEKSAYEWGTLPGDGCTTRAILILHIARKAKSASLTSSALTSIYNLVYALSNWSEQLTIYQNPESAGAEKQGIRVLGGSITTHGTELAWVCEQFLVDQYNADDKRVPARAKSVLKNYVQWRKAVLKETLDSTCLPAEMQFKTIDYAKRFADQLKPSAVKKSK